MDAARANAGHPVPDPALQPGWASEPKLWMGFRSVRCPLRAWLRALRREGPWTSGDVGWGAVNERRIRCQVTREPPPRSPPQNFSWTARPSPVAPLLFRNQPASSQGRVKWSTTPSRSRPTNSPFRHPRSQRSGWTVWAPVYSGDGYRRRTPLRKADLVDGPPPENCHRRQLWPKAAAVATHESDVLDEVTERRLLTRNLRTLNALTDPTVLEPVIAGVTAGSKGRAQCRRSGACPCVSGAAAWTGVTVGLKPLRGRGSRCSLPRPARRTVPAAARSPGGHPASARPGRGWR
ncbi:hypothetical protein SAURM35S_04205 [Streptomyces aurantiogriseus]